MEADELAEVDRQLRGICVQHGLDWVASQVDGLISQGRDAFLGEEAYFHGRRDYSGSYPLFASGSRPASAGVRSLPFAPTDRTLLLIDAMLTVFIQLPSAQADAIRMLRQGFEGRASVVGSISFAEDDQVPAVAVDGDDLNYQAVVATLQRLRAEVAQP